MPPQIREGKVQNVSAKEAGKLVKEGWVLLDVRPPTEIANVRPRGLATQWAAPHQYCAWRAPPSLA